MVLKIGDAIPECTIPATSGLTFSPSSCLGKNLVLYFYPKDATPGCTVEAGNFRDHIDQFTKANAVVIGVSRDSLKSHESFKSKYEKRIRVNKWLCKNMYGKQVQGIERSTFIIDSKGILRNEWRGIKVAGHVEEVLKTVLALS